MEPSKKHRELAEKEVQRLMKKYHLTKLEVLEMILQNTKEEKEDKKRVPPEGDAL